MAYSATVLKTEDTMINSKKCACGASAKVEYVTKLGRIKDTLVNVHNVPVYKCKGCDEKFMAGSDSIKFAKSVSEAVEKNISEINF
jgi:hypothetical protein